MSFLRQALSLAIFAVLASLAYGPVYHHLKVLGAWRRSSQTAVAAKTDLITIEDTLHCEDLHHYLPSNILFTACEDSITTRFSWFPPLAHFGTPPSSGGSFHVIDPEIMKSKRLAFENFSGRFVTHGIDVVTDPNQPDSVYIFAVNHLPNPEFSTSQSKAVPKARSQIELFHHVLGSTSVRHVRSIRHPLINTPNDIYARSPNSFYITNDHSYREGFLRHVEEILPIAKWSSTVHVSISDLEAKDADSTVTATVALMGIHNNNGMGHGQSDEEILITSAASGILYRAYSSRRPDDFNITVAEAIHVDSTVDNPSYFSDPYRTGSDDASGYILPGLTRAIDLGRTKTDPSAKDGVMVWHVKQVVQDGNSSAVADPEKWKKRLIFEDDGTRIRTASAAVLIPIDPVLEGGKKKGWLFVTGFLSENMIAVKIDL